MNSKNELSEKALQNMQNKGQLKNQWKIALMALLTTAMVSGLAHADESESDDSADTGSNIATTTAPRKKTTPAKPRPTKPTPSIGDGNTEPSPVSPSSGDTAGNEGGPIQSSGQVLFDTCFSPKADCDQKLIQFISNAKSSLSIAIYSITHTGISQAIIDAKNRGVSIRMVVDRSESKGKSSQVSALVSAGIDLKIGNFSGIMHDKFTIVDGSFLEEGSYNYTANATNNNGENQLYLNEPTVIQRYQENFDQMYQNGLASN